MMHTLPMRLCCQRRRIATQRAVRPRAPLPARPFDAYAAMGRRRRRYASTYEREQGAHAVEPFFSSNPITECQTKQARRRNSRIPHNKMQRAMFHADPCEGLGQLVANLRCEARVRGGKLGAKLDPLRAYAKREARRFTQPHGRTAKSTHPKLQAGLLAASHG